MENKDVIEVLALAFTVLGCTWRLSAQIAALATKLEEHIKSDDHRFTEADDFMKEIAPRQVRLQQRTG